MQHLPSRSLFTILTNRSAFFPSTVARLVFTRRRDRFLRIPSHPSAFFSRLLLCVPSPSALFIYRGCNDERLRSHMVAALLFEGGNDRGNPDSPKPISIAKKCGLPSSSFCGKWPAHSAHSVPTQCPLSAHYSAHSVPTAQVWGFVDFLMIHEIWAGIPFSANHEKINKTPHLRSGH